jgi:hypothetical protein
LPLKLRGQEDAEMATRRKELEKKLSNFRGGTVGNPKRKAVEPK